jgi:galactofuranose transport system permease protein
VKKEKSMAETSGLVGARRLQGKERGRILVQTAGTLIFFVIMVAFNSVFTNNFFSVRTFWLLIIQSFPTIVLAVGMTFVISSGGIDISVGAIMAFSGTVLAALMVSGVPLVVCMLVALAGAVLVGLLNGFFISKFDVQPIIMTLVTMLAVRGFAQVVTAGNPVPFSYMPLNKIANFRLWSRGMPLQFLLALCLALIAFFVIKRTVFGNHIQSIGNNKTAAYFSGVNTSRVIISVYIISAVAAGVASIIEVGRESQAEAARMGSGMELNAIAAVAVGGTSLTGGRAHIWGSVLGALIMQLVITTINMNGILSSWGLIAKAAILVLAVIPQVYRRKD